MNIRIKYKLLYGMKWPIHYLESQIILTGKPWGKWWFRNPNFQPITWINVKPWIVPGYTATEELEISWLRRLFHETY